MENGDKTIVIIPAHNEEKSVGRLIRQIREADPGYDVLVVNDGSLDSTGTAARKEGAAVLNLPYNVGIGAAMQGGYKWAYRNGYGVAVQCDGDGQHRPMEIRKLLDALESEKADMVIGSRFLKKRRYRSSPLRRAGSMLFSLIISSIARQKLTDTTSGFRAVNRKVMKAFSAYYPSDYPEVESLVFLHRQGFTLREIPVNMSRRKDGESSISGGWIPFYYMVKVLLAVLVNMCRQMPFENRERED